MTNVREIAFDTLLMYERGEQDKDLLGKVLDKYSFLEKQERSFLTRLYEGSLERKITIDYILSLYSKVPVNKMKLPVRILLRMGVYQIMYMDSVPDSAACNETVKLARKRSLSNLSGFINGVLRNVARSKNEIKYPDINDNEVRYLSIMYSCPEWIAGLLCKEQGIEGAISVLENSVRIRPITGRVNISKCTPQIFFETNSEFAYESKLLPYALGLHNIDKISDLPSFVSGDFTIQDIASMLVVHVSGIKKTDTVIDVCASPGGKSLHAADLAVEGQVISCDISDSKLIRIEENVNRCGFENISLKCADARVRDEELIGKADLLIADVPCSGLGVMGRKNDIKYNLKEEQMAELPVLQRQIIDNIVDYLKPGGTLMYSTCTVHKAENVDNYRYIIEKKGLEAVGFYDELPVALRDETAKEGYLQLLGKDGLTDGFFIAKFRKI